KEPALCHTGRVDRVGLVAAEDMEGLVVLAAVEADMPLSVARAVPPENQHRAEDGVHPIPEPLPALRAQGSGRELLIRQGRSDAMGDEQPAPRDVVMRVIDVEGLGPVYDC